VIILFLDEINLIGTVFHPRKTSVPSSKDPRVKVLQFQISDEINIGGICYLKDVNLPTILMYHGNGEIATDYAYFISSYFDIDVNLAVMDFRGYGFSTGKPTYSCLYTDAYPGYNHFRDWMQDNSFNNSLFVKGRSLGSACAAEIASHNPEDLKGVIFESGFSSTYDMMIRLFGISGPQVTQENLKEYSNEIRVKKILKPTLVIHGTSDWIVPFEQGQAIFDNLSDSIEKVMIPIRGAGHNDISSFESEYFPPLKEFIQKYK
jgi:pimeloyl-ACP methyl ester carboxylesterase